MKVSLSEIQTMATKAAFGSGLPFGLAEDTGIGVRLLSRSGLSAVEWLTITLENHGPGFLVCPLEQRVQGDVWLWSATTETGTLCPLVVGPSLADFIVAAGESMPHRISVENVAAPMLVLGFLALSGISLKVTWNNDTAHLSGGRIRQYTSATNTGLLDANPTTVNIEMDNHDVQQSEDGISAHWDAAPKQGIEVDPRVWRRLESIAANILVPDSEVSRTRGAGAGLVDTD